MIETMSLPWSEPALPPLDVARLLARAECTLAPMHPLLDAASAQAPVSPASRQLCAALGVLAEEAYVALGGRDEATQHAVGQAAGLLALLTKVDDEVIDAQRFHGGPLRRGDDDRLAQRVREHLRPTLLSLRQARAVDAHPRCALAAAFGQAIARLQPDPRRREQLLAVIARGWEVQARGVVALSRHPADSSEFEVARVTASISGDWLLMITMVGATPPDVHRGLTPAEQRAFRSYGWLIQRADALADFVKDHQSGLANSYAGFRVHARAPHEYVRRCEAGDGEGLLDLLFETRADLDCLPPDRRGLERLGLALRGLGQVPRWLAWIHGFLLWRYATLVGRRGPDDANLRPFMTDMPAWASYVAAVARQG